MGVCRVGNKWNGREETGKGGDVNAAIHINKAKAKYVEVLVAGIAPVEKESSGHVGKTPVGRVAAAAPGIESQGFQFSTCTVGNYIVIALGFGVDIFTRFQIVFFQ